MAATRERRVWSDLQPELLELVLRRLVLKDYLKCRQVCGSWRRKVNNAIKIKCPPLPQFPSLLLHSNNISSHGNDHTLLDITVNKLQLTPTCAWKGFFKYVQSKDGWLMLQEGMPIQHNNINHTLFWIFNPVSSEKYKLPLLPCSPNRVDKVAFSSAPDSQNFLVVVLKCFRHDDPIPLQLCFCKVNDKSWTHIETNESSFKDIMLLGEKLFAVNANSVTIFNVKDPNAITIERLVVQLPRPNWGDQVQEIYCGLVRDYSTCGEVMLVFVARELYEYKIYDTRIFKLDMRGPIWIELDSLSGRALFVDGEEVQVISTANLNGPPEFTQGNCVFFSLYPYPSGVFFLKGKTTQTLHYVPTKAITYGHLWCKWCNPCPW